MPLRAFAAFSESTLFGPIRSMLLKQNGYTQALIHTSYPEKPLMVPDTSGWRSVDALQSILGGEGDVVTVTTPLDAAAAVAVAGGWTGVGNTESALTNETINSSRILDFHRAYLSKQTTPTLIAERLIDVITTTSPPHPFFISFNPDAIRRAAAESTARYASNQPLSVFDGVLFGVKDEVDVEGHPTSAGTCFMAQHRAPITATLPAALELCSTLGAVLTGKLNMHEIGIGTTGLNPGHGGTPPNPWSPNHHTGGSSSGSASIVACGLLPFAIGSDGGGSVRIPSALCGVVGLKPTYNRVCALPGPGITHSVCAIGPICSTVFDCALVYGVMSAAGSNGTATAPAVQIPRFKTLQQKSKPTPLRVGIYTEWFDHGEPSVVECCRKTLSLLNDAKLIEIVEITIPFLRELAMAHSCTIASEMKCGMLEHLENSKLRRQLDPSTRITFAVADGFTVDAYLNSQKIRRRVDTIVRKIFNEDGVDCIATPTTPIPAPPIRPGSLQSGLSDLSLTTKLMRFCQIANMLGLPALTVPVGLSSSGSSRGSATTTSPPLPIGLQFMAPAWNEAVLLYVASMTEQVVNAEGSFTNKPPLYWDLLQQ